jgi:UDP-N-acetylglucosamine/UDP-N-acetylgalactosamine diphosphorylase
MDLESLRKKLALIGQDNVLRSVRQGDSRLVKQLSALDLDLVASLVESHVKHKPQVEIPQSIIPATAYPHDPGSKYSKLYADADRRGRELLAMGKVGAFLVAGGQGTRLGYNGPKGEFPVTPICHKPLFQVFAETLLAWSRDAGRPVPWYIMTSTANDQPTREFFKKHGYFGVDPKDIFFFEQGMMPAFSMDGQLLLGEKDSLALSPDGHGGSLRAIVRSGALDDMKARGVEHLSYFQVDNPLVYCIDPLFIGLHDLSGSEMSSKTLPKSGPLEKVGNFVIADGTLQVIEYSDLPESLARETNANGSLKFNAGSIAIHALRVSFIERLNAGGKLKLPWHRAEKKVPFLDAAGNLVKPDKPNAVKLEQFVFDAIPLAKDPIVYTTDRAEEFSPVKNAEGADSPASCARDLVRRAGRWLGEAGIEVPMHGDDPQATLEISPLLATSAAQLRERELKVEPIKPGASIYFGSTGIRR